MLHRKMALLQCAIVATVILTLVPAFLTGIRTQLQTLRVQSYVEMYYATPHLMNALRCPDVEPYTLFMETRRSCQDNLP